MLLASVSARGFRNLDDDTAVALPSGLTLISGPNGAGKTNLLEAAFLALTGSSPRTNRLREVVGFGKQAARVKATIREQDGSVEHEIVSAVDSRGERRRTVDGAAPGDERSVRPPAIVFMPDRLDLVKGGPAGRRAHLDRLAAALWAGEAEHRRAYGAALAQRNALLGAIRAGRAGREALTAWDETLARAGANLAAGRVRAVEAIAAPFGRWAESLGLAGSARVRYRARVECAGDPGALLAALAERTGTDVDRGHTTTGPHHDELVFERSERALRRYGSQGEQRMTLLALLLAEREVVGELGGVSPVALFDDVMSELDPKRRGLLAAALGGPGQSLVTTTDAGHVPDEAAVAASWRVEGGTVTRA